MERAISLVGNLVALAGILLCAAAGIARVLGFFLFSGYTTMTLFQVGTGLMVLACLLKLETLMRRIS